MSIDRLGPATPARPAERAPAPRAAPDPARAPGAAVDTAAAARAAAAAPSLAQVNEAVSRLNQSPQAKSQGLEFSVDSDSRRTVVKVVDQSTREVLRQIPTPEALDIANALAAQAHTGLLLRQTA